MTDFVLLPMCQQELVSYCSSQESGCGLIYATGRFQAVHRLYHDVFV